MVLPGIAAAVDALMRADGGRLLAHLVGAVRDFQLAEDSLQDALESALHHWSRNGLPRSPPAWVMQTARRKAIDRLRRSASFRAKSTEIAHLIDLDAHAAFVEAETGRQSGECQNHQNNDALCHVKKGREIRE